MKKTKHHHINRRRAFLDYKWICIEWLVSRFAMMENITKKYSNYRHKLVDEELNMCAINSKDRILVIGCGPYPYTAMALAQMTKAEVVVIDKSLRIVKLASSVIHRKNLHHTVSIQQGDGVDYPMDDFDVIIVTITLWPIDKILVHIFQEMKPRTRLICREIDNDVEEVLKGTKLSEMFTIKASMHHSAGEKYKSLLLQKNI